MDRRKFMEAGVAAAAGAAFSGLVKAEGKYDLVLSNVNALIDGAFRPCDLGIRGRRIVEIAPPNTLTDAVSLIQDPDLYVSPGWVDLHVHLVDWRHGKTAGSSVSRLGTDLGVTALVDAGTVGSANYEKFEKAAAVDPALPCYSWLNICREGIKLSDFYRTRPGWEDLPAMEKRAAKPGNKIVGVKYRADRQVSPQDDRLYYVRKCREASDLLKKPVMIHIGGPPPFLSDILPFLKEGDLITHFLRGQGNSIIGENGRVRDEVKEAYARGVRFDVGHGMASFTFADAERALDQGFTDFTISSDLYIMSARLYAKTFANVLTQFLVLGLPLAEIMERAAVKPAKVLGLEREIKLGAEATLTAFKVRKGNWSCMDVIRKIRKSQKRIFPIWTIIAGKCLPAGTTDLRIFGKGWQT